MARLRTTIGPGSRCSVLHEFIAENRDEIIRRCRAKVPTRSIPPPTVADDYGVPVFLDQLRRATPRRAYKPRDQQERD